MTSPASDPGTPIEELRRLAPRRPSTVLGNPAWQLAMVAQAGFLHSLGDRTLAALASAPAAGSEVLTDVARTCGRDANRWRDTVMALAVRADIPHGLLQEIAGDHPPGRPDGNALDLVRHRASRVAGSLEGWHAFVPALAMWWNRMPAFERTPVNGSVRADVVGSLVKAGAVPLHSPFIRGFTMMSTAEHRLRMVVNAGDRDPAWTELTARASVVGPSGGVPDVHIWRECLHAAGGCDPHRCLDSRHEPSLIASDPHREVHFNEWRVLSHLWLRGEVYDGSRRLVKSRYRRETMSLRRAIPIAAGAPFFSMVHLTLLACPCCPVDLLERRARSRSVLLRAVAASNPSLPARLRARLRRDTNWIVRGAATAAMESAAGAAVGSARQRTSRESAWKRCETPARMKCLLPCVRP